MGYDSDSALFATFDPLSKRIFVFPDGQMDIEVVDVTNPTQMKREMTFEAGEAVSTSCSETDCVYELMDFGGKVRAPLARAIMCAPAGTRALPTR